jgi:hypothetical protein
MDVAAPNYFVFLGACQQLPAHWIVQPPASGAGRQNASGLPTLTIDVSNDGICFHRRDILGAVLQQNKKRFPVSNESEKAVHAFNMLLVASLCFGLHHFVVADASFSRGALQSKLCKHAAWMPGAGNAIVLFFLLNATAAASTALAAVLVLFCPSPLLIVCNLWPGSLAVALALA